MGSFSNYLQDCGLVAQYGMPGTPKQSGVAEKKQNPNG